MLFKIMNQLVELPSEGLLIPSCTYTRGHNKKLWQLQARIDSYQNFFPDAIKLWNKLPDHLRHLVDITDLNIPPLLFSLEATYSELKIII